jgi:glucose-1-phosphate adenylyltransferase
VIFEDVRIGRGAQVTTSIVDEGSTVGRRAEVGARPGRRAARDEDLVLIGMESRVGTGVTVAPGDRLEPGTSA